MLKNVGTRLSILHMPIPYSTESFSYSNNTTERDQDDANRNGKNKLYCHIKSYPKISTRKILKNDKVAVYKMNIQKY